MPDDQVEFHEALGARWREAGHGDSDDVVLQRRDGTRFDASVTLALASGPDGEPLGSVADRPRHLRRASATRRTSRAWRRTTRSPASSTIAASTSACARRSRAAAATARRLSLAILDLDHFKHVNDTYGHPVGDRVLAEIGRRLRSLTRLGEHIARVGGEEFAWILPGTDGAGAHAAGERARRAVEREPFAHIGHLTVSVGVCELGDGADADELHRLADVALY